MAIKRITLSDLAFGQPLRWDIFGADAAPLLQKGELLTPSPQLDGWLADGLYADAEAHAPLPVLRSLNRIAEHLERLIAALPELLAAETELRHNAHELLAAVERDADIALASIFLNQVAASFGVRHSIETAIVTAVIGRALGRPPSELLSLTAAALTMNVAMLNYTESFRSRESALSGEERAIMRRHPGEAVQMLIAAGVSDQEWLDCVLLHHEHEDGSGYPDGKQGAEVSQNAKLIAMADRYCAFVAARNYRCSLLPDVALNMLCAQSKYPIDAVLAWQFSEQLGAYPPGTFVRLDSGAVAVVTHRAGEHGVLALHVLKDADGKPLASPQPRHSGEAGCAIEAALHEDEAAVRFSMQRVWGELASL